MPNTWATRIWFHFKIWTSKKNNWIRNSLKSLFQKDLPELFQYIIVAIHVIKAWNKANNHRITWSRGLHTSDDYNLVFFSHIKWKLTQSPQDTFQYRLFAFRFVKNKTKMLYHVNKLLYKLFGIPKLVWVLNNLQQSNYVIFWLIIIIKKKKKYNSKRIGVFGRKQKVLSLSIHFHSHRHRKWKKDIVTIRFWQTITIYYHSKGILLRNCLCLGTK